MDIRHLAYMSKPNINIIWFKRDLRLQDHAALAQAIADGIPCLLWYCFEPSLMAAPETDLRHWRFVYESLQDLQKQLRAYSKKIYWVHSEVIPSLANLSEHSQIQHMYSHAETGIKQTFDRDKAVKKWCLERGIQYQEFPHDGVIRGRKHRRGWVDQLEKSYFKAPLAQLDLSRLNALELPEKLLEEWAYPPLPVAIQTPQEGFQPGGETTAWRYLHSFFQERGKNYSLQLSKPAASRISCSRLSPYLAYGCISSRSVMQLLRGDLPKKAGTWNLKNFRSRLWWRSHFIQKLESNWRIEFEPINPVFNQLERLTEGPFLESWKAGQTGFPMIDASMRCLQANGWVNFRMRAMLVSFASFALWLDWRPVAVHLARLFLDFDPGIHYPQIQMQAGLTGYHTLRIYNPATQVVKHDSEGVFIKKWVPELQHVPASHLAEPWKMTAMEQSFYQCKIGQDYPAPLVDFESVITINKDRYWQLRQSATAKQALPKLLEQFCVPKDIVKYQQETNTYVQE